MHPPATAPQSGHPIAPDLELTSTYGFADSDEFAEASERKTGAGYVYARWANRTVDAFESAIADLEGADEAEAFASGMAGISTTLLSLCSPGDRVVAARQLYGGTFSVLSRLLPRFGIQTVLLDQDDLDAWTKEAAGARLLYVETIGNPAVKLADVPAIGRIANDAGVPLVVDNTFASPVLCRPIEHGASLVLHSATKFLGGHHDLLGGVVCGSGAILEEIKAMARELGATLAPFNAWLGLRGIATLPVRVERSSSTARRLAEFLKEHPDIVSVGYPGIDPSSRERTERVLGGRGGGTVAFEVDGGRERASKFQEELDLISPAASLGGTHSLIVHAASVTHTQLNEAQLSEAGISPGFCRLSVGLEAPDDLLRDIERALAASA